MIGTFYIVGTPIGNLADITFRAIDTLKIVDLILCEDTRVTQNLLNHYEIKTPTMSYHQHSDEKRVSEIKSLLEEGKNLALVTDAGTPGISDPGNKLIADLRFFLPKADPSLSEISDLVIVPIPGASAIITALSISGFPTDKYIFMGFPPNKNKRIKFFKEVADAKYTVAFYESSHRIKKALEELKEVLKKDAKLCICRELTKKFESIYCGSIEDMLNKKIPEKGEFVVVISK